MSARPVPQLSAVRLAIFLQLVGSIDARFFVYPHPHEAGVTVYALHFPRAFGGTGTHYTARSLRELVWAVHRCGLWRNWEDLSWAPAAAWFSTVRNSDWLEAQATAAELHPDEAAADSIGAKPSAALVP